HPPSRAPGPRRAPRGEPRRRPAHSDLVRRVHGPRPRASVRARGCARTLPLRAHAGERTRGGQGRGGGGARLAPPVPARAAALTDRRGVGVGVVSPYARGAPTPPRACA